MLFRVPLTCNCWRLTSQAREARCLWYVQQGVVPCWTGVYIGVAATHLRKLGWPGVWSLGSTPEAVVVLLSMLLRVESARRGYRYREPRSDDPSSTLGWVGVARAVCTRRHARLTCRPVEWALSSLPTEGALHARRVAERRARRAWVVRDRESAWSGGRRREGALGLSVWLAAGSLRTAGAGVALALLAAGTRPGNLQVNNSQRTLTPPPPLVSPLRR